ncbi:unnamed protein product [Caenorhabditis angaria]|uniref:Uncharacterized protein n=1 Tax=Caenorhabditis angaria TaxID=860376 RepID=A0A9P1IU05_9PELO|nr:unnamed protein product [Caenorhabditis angaria]
MILPILLILTYLIYKIICSRDKLLELHKIRRICIEEFKKFQGPPYVPIFGSTWYFSRDAVGLERQRLGWQRDFAWSADSCGLMKVWFEVRAICKIEFEKIRGPPSVPVFGSTWYFKRDPVGLARQGQGWSLDYGCSADASGLAKFWMGPLPIAAILHGNIAKQIFDSSENITKSSQYNKVREWIGDGLLVSTNEKWRSRRKLLTHAFHFKVLQQYQKIFCVQGKVLTDVLQLRANGKVAFDILPYIKRCTLDIICETAMGVSIGSQRGSNDKYVSSVKRVSELIWKYETYPINWFKPFWYLSGRGYEFDKNVKISTDFTRNVIEKRKLELENRNKENQKDEENEKLAFLDLLLQAQKEQNLSDEDIREEVDTFMFEGHDTTSSGITFTIWFLGQNPEYQQKVQDELDEIFGEDFERAPTSEDLKRMVYLEQCIKETLRITPPVPFVSRRLTEDVYVPHPTKSPVRLPAGMSILINIIAIMKDPRHFERPHEFFPDHFDPIRTAQREAFAYVPFSAGPRNCIGQKFALLEEKILLSWIFRRFIVESQTKFPDEIPIAELVLKPLNGTSVILKNRQKL